MVRGRNGPGSVRATRSTIAGTSSSVSGRIVAMSGSLGTSAPRLLRTIWWPFAGEQHLPSRGRLGKRRLAEEHHDPVGRERGEVVPRVGGRLVDAVEHRHIRVVPSGDAVFVRVRRMRVEQRVPDRVRQHVGHPTTASASSSSSAASVLSTDAGDEVVLTERRSVEAGASERAGDLSARERAEGMAARMAGAVAHAEAAARHR